MPNLQEFLDLSRKLNPQELQKFLSGQGRPNYSSISPSPNIRVAPEYETLVDQPAPIVSTSPIEDTVTRLRRLSSSPPLMEDYRPSLKRRIGAGLAGFATGLKNPRLGVEVAESVRNSPFNSQYQDWVTQTKALENQANIENEQRKTEFTGIGNQARLLSTLNAGNPGLQAEIAGKRKAAITPYDIQQGIEVRAPGIAAQNIRSMEDRTAQDVRSEADRVSREQIAKENRTSREKIVSSTLAARVADFEREFGIKIDSLNLRKKIFNLNRIKAVRGVQASKIQADQEALKILSGRPDYVDFIVQDPKTGALTFNAKSLQESTNWIGARKYSDEDILDKLEQLKHDKSIIMNGLLKTADEFGDIEMPEEE